MVNDFSILMKSIFATALVVFTLFVLPMVIIESLKSILPQDIKKEVPQKYIILECREKK